VIGSGNLNLSGSGIMIEGSVFTASLVNEGGMTGFGVPNLALSGDVRILSNLASIRMAVGLIPPAQISFREIASTDP